MITTSSPTHTGAAPSVPGTVPEEDSDILVSQTDCVTRQCQVTETHIDDSGDHSGGGEGAGEELDSSTPGGGGGGAAARGSASGPTELQDFQAQNRRLLPNFKNPLHVIDGPEQRYFIGIIDIFTVYGFRKRLEHLWKRLRYPRQAFSTVSPPAYCTRLCQWVQDHTT